MADPIIFLDLRQTENDTIQRIDARVFQLKERQRQANGNLPPALDKELKDLEITLRKAKSPAGKNTVADPLFTAIQKDLSLTNEIVGDHKDGKLPSQQAVSPKTHGDLSSAEQTLAVVYGILTRDHITNPELGRRFTVADCHGTWGI